MVSIIGVDFSGAARAGRKIWLTTGETRAQKLLVTGCFRSTALNEGDSSRAAALAALRSLVAASPGAAIGCDFPFGLPQALVDAETWEAFVRGFGDRYLTPEAFRSSCRRRDGGHELKRATDVDARVPFASYNLRLYRQTYYGIRDLLAPLVAERSAAVVPMMSPRPDRAMVLEVCPASALKRLGLYRSYKGRGSGLMDARASILDMLLARDDLDLTENDLRDVIIADPEGDALDSLIAATITYWAVRAPDWSVTDDPKALVEGRVYF